MVLEVKVITAFVNLEDSCSWDQFTIIRRSLSVIHQIAQKIEKTGGLELHFHEDDSDYVPQICELIANLRGVKSVQTGVRR